MFPVSPSPSYLPLFLPRTIANVTVIKDQLTDDNSSYFKCYKSILQTKYIIIKIKTITSG